MPDIADPLIQGMMAGLRFKEVFQRAKQQREELDMRKQALADARAQRERQNELHELTLRRQGLQDRLEMATNPALEDVTGSGGTRNVTAAVPPEMQSPVGLGPTFSMEAPVENPIEYEGRQYAVRGPQERFNERIQNETALARAKYGATAVPFETGEGTLMLPPTAIPGAMSSRAQMEHWRALQNKPTPPPKPVPETPAEANARRHKEWIDLGKKPEGPDYISYRLTGKLPTPKGTAGGTGSLAAQRFEFAKTEAARKAQESEDAKKEAKLQELLKEEDKHHTIRSEVGSLATSGALDNKEQTQATGKFAASTQAIQDIQHRKAKLLGAAIPPKQAQDVIKEGESRTAPDGHVWLKKGGILYIVK